MHNFEKFLLNRKTNNLLRIAILILVFMAIIFTILSYDRDIGTYVFKKGSSPESDFIEKDGKFLFKKPSPVIGEVPYWGNDSSLTVSIAMLSAALIGSIAQLTKLFNKRHVNNNFTNSLVNVIFLIIGLGFSGLLSAIIIIIFAVLIQLLLLYASILVEYRSRPYIENSKKRAIATK